MDRLSFGLIKFWPKPLLKLFYIIFTLIKKIIFIIRIKQIAEGCNRQFGLRLVWGRIKEDGGGGFAAGEWGNGGRIIVRGNSWIFVNC
ncbi:hypothetical protein NST04_10185 [Paenibacillus sp. FSL H7-0756]|uniref:hypothetical protein n=1 Tax=unclassified Paenibacillus TaxID=185978 RepID=UPI0030FA7A28